MAIKYSPRQASDLLLPSVTRIAFTPYTPMHAYILARKEPKRLCIRTPTGFTPSCIFHQAFFFHTRIYSPALLNTFITLMANGGGMKPVATLLLLLNFCMYVIVGAIGGWALNRAIDYGFIIGKNRYHTILDKVFHMSCCVHSPVTQFYFVAGPDLQLPAHFSPIFFPMGNAATGFFVVFALIASVVGAASALAGLNHIRLWHADSLPSAASVAMIAWTLTLLAMG